MNWAPFSAGTLRTPCRIEITHSGEALHANVILEEEVAIAPGDSVRVEGDPIRIAFGESIVLRRTAQVERAGWMRRWWTRLAAQFDLTELYEVSFTPRRRL